MKRNVLTISSVAMIAAFGLVACGDDSSSVPDQCTALAPECGYTVEELCRMGEKQYCPEQSSSSIVEVSSSSVENGESSSSVEIPESSSAVNSRNSSSSNSGETCIHMSDMPPDSDSDPWCFGDEGKHAVDCFTNEAYTCTDGFWVKDADMCIHISDSESASRWDCDAPDYTLKADCANSDSLYMCAAGMWIAAKDCDTTQERCGYSDADLCMYFGIMKYCSGSPRVLPDAVPCNQDGKSVVIDGQWMYRCDNGRWHTVVPMGG
ncbi:hypothetical protein SAMN05720781_2878 [Fibrobacter sp. UWT3]|uniref:hypothetical protein n=1 Tax=Fibrobacter sp. UWT3 TaxID=1896225 RepID=UPI000BC70BFD|nr:hypothetical protein [Fibrobacter sp. UWT3]SOE79109.1 hypothetical protein SAMN05720781_2878 [Fibrobacter sp. UWT3]